MPLSAYPLRRTGIFAICLLLLVGYGIPSRDVAHASLATIDSQPAAIAPTATPISSSATLKTDRQTLIANATPVQPALPSPAITAISRHPATGTARFLRFAPGQINAISAQQPTITADAQALQQRGAAFWAQYGTHFGVAKPDETLRFANAVTDTGGNTHLTYRQFYENLPVFGGELRLHFNPQGIATAANGLYLPDIHLDPSPRVPVAEAQQQARQALYKVAGLTAEAATQLQLLQTTLVIFRSGVAQGVPGQNYLAYQIELSNASAAEQAATHVHTTLFIDAHTGTLIDHYSHIHEGLTRRIYNGYNNSFPAWQEGTDLPYTGDAATDVNRLASYSEDAYNLFYTLSSGTFDSWDGEGEVMTMVANHPSSCPNAAWTGQYTYFCAGVTSDDVVAHEWGHAYTQATHNLIYQWQPGALNEAYSDIWGELIDQLNGTGTDLPDTPRVDGSCTTPATSVRWLLGEDSSTGILRDLWMPTCYGDPGKVSDSQYWCSSADNGGVHFNSGVPNHAFALMVDGGSYNGQTVGALGTTKAAHIYWRAQTHYQTPYTNFADHADALEQSCSDLVGAPLATLDTDSTVVTTSAAVITAGDCAQVAAALAAVEMRAEPAQCGFTTSLDPETPALCTTGEQTDTLFFEDWEAGNSNWIIGTRDVANAATFDTPNWTLTTVLPDGRAGQSSYAVNSLAYGNCAADDDTGVRYLESPTLVAPATGASPRVAFDHWFSTETNYDGSNLKVQVNGGAWTIVPASAFRHNGYNGALMVQNNTNPMAGEASFHGVEAPDLGGTWGQSQVDLTGIVNPGDTFALRFEFGQDGCNGVTGWYVDDVRAYQCVSSATATPTLTPTAIPSATATPSATSTATAIPSHTSTSTATSAPATSTATETATATPMPTVTPTPTPTPTPTDSATGTPIPSSTSLPTATATFVPTTSPTVTTVGTLPATLTPTLVPTAVADSDADTIPDLDECGTDGICPDSDSDGKPDHIDIDSDNDGIVDGIEAYGVNGPGVTAAAVRAAPLDSDGDGLANYIDVDSDNDTVLDMVEAYDDNRDGFADRLPTGIDSDGDGLDDAYDTFFSTTPGPENAGGSNLILPNEGNGLPNWLNPDDDGDGIPTAEEVREGIVDENKNGIADYLEKPDNRIIQERTYLPLLYR